MKLVCPREELSRSLQTVLRSVGARAGIPALSGVLLELGDEDLSLTTTDLELTTRARVAISGESGRIVVPARLLADIVRNLAAEDVELISDNGTVRVSGGGARYELRSLQAEDFPKIQGAEDAKELTLPADRLATALSQIVPAASKDETRPVLTGVLLEGEGDELRIVATDSYRLGVRIIEARGADGLKLLVPSRAVGEVARLAEEGEVRVEASASQVGFHLGTVLVQSRLIEGEFPSYRQLLPEDLPSHLTIEREPFLAALKRVSLLAQDATPIFVEFDPERIRISCQSQGLGEAAEEVEGAYVGDAMRVAFNPQYLEAGIEAVEGERAQIQLSDPQRPAVIRAPEGTDFTYLLMPIRVS